MAGKLAWIDHALEELKQKGLFTSIRTIQSPQGAELLVDGRSVLNFCSNNYLGLANDPRLVSAAASAMAEWGIGPAAVRTIAGTTELHTRLEGRLASFKGAADAILFQSGFNANIATIPALVDRGDVIFSDALNHASIIDGCRLSRAKIVAYGHNDPAALHQALETHRRDFNRAMVITDGVFSMDGDIAPLPELTRLAADFDCVMMVDDAHGEGVLGQGGRGIVHHFGLQGQVDVEIGTLSKAFGVVGGYVAGDASIVAWLRQRGRPFLFSSAMTVPDTAACLAAVDILEESTELVDRLWQNTRFFKDAMVTLGYDIGRSETPITPVMLGDEHLTQTFSQALFDAGLFATGIAFPTVPMGSARIRVMISAAHSLADLEAGLDIFEGVGRQLGAI